MKAFLALTLRSIARQTRPNWRCVVAANRGADLPDLPAGAHAAWVDLPKPALPDPDGEREAFFNAIRDDKGARILAGLQDARPSGHVMVVDYDDLVSPDLAELAARHPRAPGWFLDSGLLFSGPGLSYRQARGFHRLCGTSHVVRHDLLLADADRPNEAEVRYRLGSHVFIKDLLEEAGTPLRPLPFVGAAYRIGHAQASSRSAGLISHLFDARSIARRPLSALRKLTRIRPGNRMMPR